VADPLLQLDDTTSLPLKASFISQPKCKELILNLFRNECNEFWLLFLHNQLGHFTKAIDRREPQASSALEAANESATAIQGDESGRDVSFFLALCFEEEV
jgi:hypothetical protein